MSDRSPAEAETTRVPASLERDELVCHTAKPPELTHGLCGVELTGVRPPHATEDCIRAGHKRCERCATIRGYLDRQRG